MEMKDVVLDVRERIAELGSNLGLTIQITNIKVNKKDAVGEMRIYLAQEQDEVAKIDFERSCRKYGIHAEALGKIITIDGVEYEIVGLREKKCKYPLIVKDTKTGDRYRMGLGSQIRRQIE